MPSFANGAPGNKGVFRGVAHDIVWVISIEMSRRIDKPGKVKDNAISECTCDKESIPERLSPKVISHKSRHDIAHEQGEPRITHFLVFDDGIFHQIGEIHFASSFHNIGVLFHKQPTHVSEEESTRGIVRVCVCF
jgi:hypothetical protein